MHHVSSEVNFFQMVSASKQPEQLAKESFDLSVSAQSVEKMAITMTLGGQHLSSHVLDDDSHRIFNNGLLPELQLLARWPDHTSQTTSPVGRLLDLGDVSETDVTDFTAYQRQKMTVRASQRR